VARGRVTPSRRPEIFPGTVEGREYGREIGRGAGIGDDPMNEPSGAELDRLDLDLARWIAAACRRFEADRRAGKAPAIVDFRLPAAAGQPRRRAARLRHRGHRAGVLPGRAPPDPGSPTRDEDSNRADEEIADRSWREAGRRTEGIPEVILSGCRGRFAPGRREVSGENSLRPHLGVRPRLGASLAINDHPRRRQECGRRVPGRPCRRVPGRPGRRVARFRSVASRRRRQGGRYLAQ
jgi:hypothetical protein